MSVGDYFAALSCLVDDGVALLIGTSDADGLPRAGRAWGVRMDDGRLRVVIGAEDPTLIANLDGRIVAVTGGEVRTLRSAQLKGRVVEVVEPDEEDVATADRQTELFQRGILETDGTEYTLTARLRADRLLTVVVEVTEGFDQTPGPAAGAPLEDPA